MYIAMRYTSISYYYYYYIVRKTYSQPSEEEMKSKGLTIAVQASDSMTVFVGSNPGLEMH